MSYLGKIPKSQAIAFKGFFGWLRVSTDFESFANENYDVAINLLKNNFLDIPLIIDEIFKQILDYSPKFDPDFANIRKFLSGVNADMSEF